MRVEAHDVAAGYGGVEVMGSVCAAAQSGELVGLIGPNGCGKTTLLRVLSGVLPALRGRVTLDGRPLSQWKRLEIAQRLAFVPQQEEAVFDFTVRDIVAMGRHPFHRARNPEPDRDRAVIARAMVDADVLALADRPITRLSGGEYRRTLLARALAQQAPLLLLDEPTAHLDVTHQAEILSLVRRLAETGGIGAIAALHDLNVAAEYCDRLILLSAGRVRAEGAAETVLTPEHLEAAYGSRAQIGANPATGRPMLLAVYPPRSAEARQNALVVHVICGGGVGVAIMGALTRAGCRVTAGVINRLDSDAEAADALGIATVLEAPFSPIGAGATAECARLIAGADIVLVAPVPFGNGNLANLELARQAQAAGKKIAVMLPSSIQARDFTGGAATQVIADLQTHGAETVERLDDWVGATLRGHAHAER